MSTLVGICVRVNLIITLITTNWHYFQLWITLKYRFQPFRSLTAKTAVNSIASNSARDSKKTFMNKFSIILKAMIIKPKLPNILVSPKVFYFIQISRSVPRDFELFLTQLGNLLNEVQTQPEILFTWSTNINLKFLLNFVLGGSQEISACHMSDKVQGTLVSQRLM